MLMVNVFFRRIVVGGSDLRFGQRQVDSRDDFRTDHQHQFSSRLLSPGRRPHRHCCCS